MGSELVVLEVRVDRTSMKVDFPHFDKRTLRFFSSRLH